MSQCLERKKIDRERKKNFFSNKESERVFIVLR